MKKQQVKKASGFLTSVVGIRSALHASSEAVPGYALVFVFNCPCL